MLHGDKDKLVPVEQAYMLQDKLEEKGVFNKLVSLSGPGTWMGWRRSCRFILPGRIVYQGIGKLIYGCTLHHMPEITQVPLAERMRPHRLEDLLGQEHLAGKGSILRTAIQQGKVPSMIFWGPPGTGKTTIANIIANTLDVPFYTLSAISAGVKEVREVIATAQHQEKAIFFIDEIHRFNKGQQDALLGAVEKGTITLIGATTENPSFEVNSALLSRCQVYVLKPLDDEDLVAVVEYAIEER